MPPRDSREAVVGALVGELLHNGQASRLYQALVKEKKVAIEVSGGVNWPLGNPFEYNGPTLMASRIVYPTGVKETDVLACFDAVVADLAAKGAAARELERVSSKMRSDWYSQLEGPVDRATVLAHSTLCDGNPSRVDLIPGELAQVTSDEVKAFARKYLVATNRTVINRVPAAPAEKPKGAN
jgi:predicted Zn-dependent peptidase